MGGDVVVGKALQLQISRRLCWLWDNAFECGGYTPGPGGDDWSPDRRDEVEKVTAQIVELLEVEFVKTDEGQAGGPVERAELLELVEELAGLADRVRSMVAAPAPTREERDAELRGYLFGGGAESAPDGATCLGCAHRLACEGAEHGASRWAGGDGACALWEAHK